MKTLTFTFKGDDDMIDLAVKSLAERNGWTVHSEQTQHQFAHKVIWDWIVQDVTKEVTDATAQKLQEITAA